MFIIDFRNKLVSNNNFSVIGNNNVDIVYFYSHFTQYASGYNVYLKVISEDERYIDKILIDSENISIEGDALLVKWTMGEVSTQCKKIDVQLQFENNDESIIAQTRIVSITLGDTIDADTLIPIIYPKILTQLQEQITNLKGDSVASFDMSFANDTLIINLKNKGGNIVATEQITIALSNKVDKVKGKGLSTNDFTNALKSKLDTILLTNQADKVYGTNGNGEQTAHSVSTTASANTIVKRDNGGRIATATPINQTDATNKDYVDSIVASISGVICSWDNTSIALEDFIANCNEHLYTNAMVGKIITFTKLINGKNFRMIVIGHEHDVLANTDEGELEPNGETANLTLQFYDMPIQKVNLGLQFDTDRANGNGYVNADSEGQHLEISPAYPSNMHGYSSAVGLLNAMQEIYNSLPLVLQRAMKLVRKDCFIGDIYDDDYGYYSSTITLIKNEGDRYGSCVSAKLFCLSAKEVGMTHSTGSDDDYFAYDCEDSEENTINIEGKKYAYFDETPQNNQSESARAKRIRYYKGNAYYYWLRSPYLLDTSGWGIVDGNGGVYSVSTSHDRGVAPAFCL